MAINKFVLTFSSFQKENWALLEWASSAAFEQLANRCYHTAQLYKSFDSVFVPTVENVRIASDVR